MPVSSPEPVSVENAAEKLNEKAVEENKKAYNETLSMSVKYGKYLFPVMAAVSVALVALSAVCLVKNRPNTSKNVAAPASLALAGSVLFFGNYKVEQRRKAALRDAQKPSDNNEASPRVNLP